MEGYPAVKGTSVKSSSVSNSGAGKGRGAMSPQFRSFAVSAIMRDGPPPGSKTVFSFGQQKDLTYESVLYTCPGYVLWGKHEKFPSKLLRGIF